MFKKGDIVKCGGYSGGHSYCKVYYVGDILNLSGAMDVWGKWVEGFQLAKTTIYGSNEKPCSEGGRLAYSNEKRCKLVETNLGEVQMLESKSINSSVAKVYEKTNDAILVSKHVGSQIIENFVGSLIVKTYEKELLAEANRLEEESKKK